jgi:O-antigen ligase
VARLTVDSIPGDGSATHRAAPERPRTPDTAPTGSTERVRRWAIEHPAELLLVGIVLTLPLEISKTLFPIQQLEIARLLMLPAVVIGVAAVARGARPIPRPLVLGVLAVLAVNTLSFLATRWADGTLLAAAPIAYALVAVFVAVTVRERRTILVVGLAVLISTGYVAVIAAAQSVFGFYLWREGVLDVLGRANATFGDPNIAARFVSFGVVVGLALLQLRPWQSRLPDVAVGALLALFAAAIVVTQSRFGWLSLAVVLGLWLALHVRSPRAWAGVGVFLLAFTIVATINVTALKRAGEVVAGVDHSLGGGLDLPGDRGNLTAGDDRTYHPPRIVPGHDVWSRLPIDNVRYYLLEAGVAMWQDAPLVGLGTGAFRPMILGSYRGFLPLDRIAAPIALPHTFLAQLGAENGWVGILALSVLAVGAGLVIIRTARSEDPVIRLAAAATSLSLILIFSSSQAEGRFYVEPYLWVGIGILASIARMESTDSSSIVVEG